MTKFATEASRATKIAANKEFELPTKTIKGQTWYAIFKDHIHGGETLMSPVFKTDMIQNVCTTIKPEPWLHTTVTGVYSPSASKYIPTDEKRPLGIKESNIFAVTYVWDTREIVDVQKLNNVVVEKLLALRKRSKFLAPDNHEPLKGIDKVTKLMQRDYERYLRSADDMVPGYLDKF